MDTTLAGFKYLEIVIFIIIVIMVVLDNLKQKRKPETMPMNKDTPSKPLGKKTPRPTPYLEPSTSIEPNTSPLEV
jgi:hypothetical protein